jgi:c-di-GMP-binding flagellar brake protein YcgR
MKQSERREYFRVKDRLPIEFRSLSHDEYLKLESLIRYNPTQIVDKVNEMYFLKKIVSKSDSEKDQVYAYLQVIDKKLDIIIDHLCKSKEDDLYVSRFAEVDISGAGIRFISDVPLDKDAYVELKVILPLFPYPKISSLCSIVRMKEFVVEEMKQWQMALKFALINEEDRDILINYIFMKERERLRSSRDLAG